MNRNQENRELQRYSLKWPAICIVGSCGELGIASITIAGGLCIRCTGGLDRPGFISQYFSTTQRFILKNVIMLSCRLSYSRFRHLLGDFNECRFGRLVLSFVFTHTS